MGIFDSITDSIVDLGDWVSNTGSDLFNFASNNKDVLNGAKDLVGGAKTLFANQDARKAQAMQNVNSSFLDMGKVREKENNVDPGKAKFGLENFAANPAELEAYWHNVLQKFVQTSQTGVNIGSKFSMKR